MVLGLVLGLWLLLMGLGARLAHRCARLPAPLAALAVLLALAAVLPPVQVFLLRALRNVVFLRGAAVSLGGTVGAALVLLLPYCLTAGCALALGCSLLALEQGAAGVGRGYVAESAGSVVGGVLFSFVLVRSWDHIALLVWPGLTGLAAAGWLSAAAGGPWRWRAVLAGLGAALGAAVLWLDPDGVSARLQFTGQHIVARGNSPYGKLVVSESQGQLNFFENGLPVVWTHDLEHVEETVHYALAQRPDARSVLLVGGGVSGTARETLKYGVGRVDYVELDPLILQLGQLFLPTNLADPRIHPIPADGRRFVRRQAAQQYDVVILDLPEPSTAQLNRFYTVEFFAEVKRVLAPGGVLSFALGRYENYVSPALARLLASAQRALSASFRNVLLVPGGRVCFLASDGPLELDIAARLEQRRIPTSLVNRHYLGAMLTPDRLADLARAVQQPAALNRDFSPVLYYYHLRHWMSQFDLVFGPLQAGLVLAFGVYLVCLRRAALVLFASGFAASALELVLLLAFQVLCGSVYYQVGVIVTVFMAGLVLGAWLSNRAAGRGAGEDANSKSEVRGPNSDRRQRRRLAMLSVAVAGYAVMLGVVLPALSLLGRNAAALWALEGAIALLTLLLAVLVGLQFPLANRLQAQRPAAGVSRLFTADFVGAALGALLACALLVPLLGVAGVCWLTAALNLLAALALSTSAPRAS
jgi:spermidine synthase